MSDRPRTIHEQQVELRRAFDRMGEVIKRQARLDAEQVTRAAKIWAEAVRRPRGPGA